MASVSCPFYARFHNAQLRFCQSLSLAVRGSAQHAQIDRECWRTLAHGDSMDNDVGLDSLHCLLRIGRGWGGMLLLFRRTVTLGAIASAAALLNIVLLNFCYDVPVKLYSAHLLLMALFHQDTNLVTGAQGQVTYRQLGDSQLVISGTMDKKPVSVVLHKMDPKAFLLTTRGFHWISEDPFNR